MGYVGIWTGNHTLTTGHLVYKGGKLGVGIGNTNPTHNLQVNGTITGKQIFAGKLTITGADGSIQQMTGAGPTGPTGPTGPAASGVWGGETQLYYFTREFYTN